MLSRYALPPVLVPSKLAALKLAVSKLGGVLLVALLFVVSPAEGAACDVAVEPAATLLLPYFEVDVDDPAGATTLISISNAAPEPALTNVTFWTDWGVPTFNFPVFLTGYDVVTMNIGVALRDGILPMTANAANDPMDAISPNSNPEWDGDFEGCNGFLPLNQPGQQTIPSHLIEAFQRAHSGQSDIFNLETCSGEDHGDGKLRGYVTVDVVNRCDLLFPSEEGYFADRGTGVASNANQLFGDFYLIDPERGYAQGDSLVHIQAFDGVGEGGAFQDGDLTFYGRYLGMSAVDNREPLPMVFGARYLGDLGGSGGTDFITWRDTNSPQSAAVPCGDRPTWWPLIEHQVVDFDEQETAYVGCASIWGQSAAPSKLSPPPAPGEFACFELATQRVGIAGENGDETFVGVHDAGWIHVDFRNVDDQPSQAWILSLLSSGGQYSIGLPAAALHSACDGLPAGVDF